MKTIPYGRQTISEDDIAAVVDTLQSDFLTQGPRVAEFEREFAAKVGAPYAVAVNNGTSALHLAAMALRVGPGQKVITSPITFSASANCIYYCGGEVEFADIDPKTFLLEPKAVRNLLKKAPRGTYSGIVPVDFAGLPVDTEEFRRIADEFGIWILEDSCHAPGGEFLGKSGKRHRCGDGSLADLSIFSFHPVKHIACGEGGMVTTADKALYEHMLTLRTHGITKNPEKFRRNDGPWYHEMQELGYNFRLPDMLAALGTSQTKKLEASLARRRVIAARYDEAFSETVVKTPFVPVGRSHAWHLYVIQVENRRQTFEHLQRKNIAPQVHYIPVHRMPFYESLGWKAGSFPKAEAYYERCISLPMYPALTDGEQDHVIRSVLEVAK